MENISLSFIPTDDLIKELQSREQNLINQAVIDINKSIILINGFGIDVEHESENIKLLPNFWIDKNGQGQAIRVLYKDEEY